MVVEPHISKLSVQIGSSSSPPSNLFLLEIPIWQEVPPNYSTHAMVTHSAIFLSGLKTSCDVYLTDRNEHRQTPGDLGMEYPSLIMAVEDCCRTWTQQYQNITGYQKDIIPKPHQAFSIFPGDMLISWDAKPLPVTERFSNRDQDGCNSHPNLYPPRQKSNST